MNIDTGEIYEGEKEIQEAIDRGEPVVPVSKRVAELVKLGQRTKQQRNKEKARRRKEKKE